MLIASVDRNTHSLICRFFFSQEFLKKEFSQENIIFWKAVEQYKKIIEADKRKAKAKEIFMKHVSVKATDPINIEQNARQQVEKQLDSPSISTFERPQQEVTLQKHGSRTAWRNSHITASSSSLSHHYLILKS